LSGLRTLCFRRAIVDLRLGVKKIAFQFHDIKGHPTYESLVGLEERIGNSKKTVEKGTTDFSDIEIKTIISYCEL
jgi:hypothetical protein